MTYTPPPITGYRPLTEDQVATMNLIKQAERTVLDLLNHVRDGEDTDQRWIAIAKTNIQQGFMAFCRSVARPDE